MFGAKFGAPLRKVPVWSTFSKGATVQRSKVWSTFSKGAHYIPNWLKSANTGLGK